jgi:hypothetical protein
VYARGNGYRLYAVHLCSRGCCQVPSQPFTVGSLNCLLTTDLTRAYWSISRRPGDSMPLLGRRTDEVRSCWVTLGQGRRTGQLCRNSFTPDNSNFWSPSNLLSNGYRGLLRRGVKWSGRETGHSPSSCAQVKNSWSYNSIPHTSSWRGA